MQPQCHTYRGHKVYVLALGGLPGHFRAAFTVWRFNPVDDDRLAIKGLAEGEYPSDEQAQTAALEQAKSQLDALIRNPVRHPTQ
jgi:hypothetical protein